MEQLKITHEQARQLASAILLDIRGYVEKHKTEFKEFVASKKKTRKEVDSLASRRRAP